MVQSARLTGIVTHVQINAVRNCGNPFGVIWKPLLIAMEESGDCWLQLQYLENIHGIVIEMFFINFMEDLIDRFEKERFKAASWFASEMKESLLEIKLRFQRM